MMMTMILLLHKKYVVCNYVMVCLLMKSAMTHFRFGVLGDACVVCCIFFTYNIEF